MLHFALGFEAKAAEVNVLIAVAMRSVIDDIAPGFERMTGHKVTISYGTAGGIRDRILGGETPDLAIMPRPAMDPVVKQPEVAKALIKYLLAPDAARVIKTKGLEPG